MLSTQYPVRLDCLLSGSPRRGEGPDPRPTIELLEAGLSVRASVDVEHESMRVV